MVAQLVQLLAAFHHSAIALRIRPTWQPKAFTTSEVAINFYKHHLGDYAQATGHLTFVEDAAYSLLLRKYYADERPIPAEIKFAQRLVGARTREEKNAVQTVLEEFFILESDGWHNKRCDAELEKANAQADTNRKIAEDRETKRRERLGHDIDTNRSTIGRPSQTPDTRHQTPLIPLPPNGGCPIEPAANPDPTDLLGDAKPTSGLPDCPYSRLLALWAKHLPHLTQPRVWEGNRKATMRSRWHQAAKPSAYSPKGYATEPEGIAWWDSFFAYIANDTTLAEGFGTNGRTWRPDLEWVCNAANFQKIIDGKYTK